MAEYLNTWASWAVGHRTAALQQQSAHAVDRFFGEDVTKSAFTRATLPSRLEAVGPDTRERESVSLAARGGRDEMRAAGVTEGTKDEREDGAAAAATSRFAFSASTRPARTLP